MVRRVAYLTAVTGIALAVAGCLGVPSFERRASWRDAEERACMRSRAVEASMWIEPVNKINGKGACGVEKPLKVKALGDGTISIGPDATIGCPMTVALERWMQESVQPAAVAWFGVPVTEIKQVSAYYCRTRNSAHGAPLSEHAFGNALDIAGFVLLDGRTVTVLKDWKGGDENERGFLREVYAQSCNYFKTTLGPGVKYHADHFHLDLAHHDEAGTRRYCRPQMEIPPLRPGVGGMVIAQQPPTDLVSPTAALHSPVPVAAPSAYPDAAYPDAAYPDAAYPQPAQAPSAYPSMEESVGAMPDNTYWPRRLPPADIPMSYAQ
jgi:hypothetical protein